MHDSTASSFIGSEDGSPSCSSSDEFEYRMPSVLSSECAGNSTLYFTDGLYPGHEILTGPPYGCGSKEYVIDLMFLESGSGGVGAKLSEARMAARRAEEAGQRVDAIRNVKHTMNSDNLQDVLCDWKPQHPGGSKQHNGCKPWSETCPSLPIPLLKT